MQSSVGPEETLTEQTTTPLFHIRAAKPLVQKEELTYNHQTTPVYAPGILTHTSRTTSDHGIRLHVSPEETYHKISLAIEHHDQLLRRHQLLQKSFQQGKTDPEVLRQIFQDDFNAFSGIRTFLESCLASIPIQMRPTARSTIKAEKVFNTAELVGAILRFLPPFDILSAVQLNRTTLKAISGSPVLQEILHLRPLSRHYISTVLTDPRFTGIQIKIKHNWNSYDEIPDLETTSVSDTDSDFQQAFDVEITFKAPLDADGKQVLPPRIGDLPKTMQICSPQIRKMKYWPTCCKNDLSSSCLNLWAYPLCPSPVKTIVANEGVTIGDIYDLAVSTLKEHRLCPHARPEFHDADGVVNPDIKFEATFLGRPDDPYPVELSEATRWCAEQSTDAAQHVLAYAKRKRRLHIMGLPIPTFAEFKAEGKEEERKHDRMMKEFLSGMSPHERRQLCPCW